MTTKIKNNYTCVLGVAGVNIGPGKSVGLNDRQLNIAKRNKTVEIWLNTPVSDDSDKMILEIVGGDESPVAGSDNESSEPAAPVKAKKTKPAAPVAPVAPVAPTAPATPAVPKT